MRGRPLPRRDHRRHQALRRRAARTSRCSARRTSSSSPSSGAWSTTSTWASRSSACRSCARPTGSRCRAATGCSHRPTGSRPRCVPARPRRRGRGRGRPVRARRRRPSRRPRAASSPPSPAPASSTSPCSTRRPLQPLDVLNEPARIATAVWFGDIRLIDNRELTPIREAQRVRTTAITTPLKMAWAMIVGPMRRSR